MVFSCFAVYVLANNTRVVLYFYLNIHVLLVTFDWPTSIESTIFVAWEENDLLLATSSKESQVWCNEGNTT